jgi:hypothetical protein
VLVAFVTVGTSQEGQLPEGAAKDDTDPLLLPHADPVLDMSPALLICRQELPLDAAAPVSVMLGADNPSCSVIPLFRKSATSVVVLPIPVKALSDTPR